MTVIPKIFHQIWFGSQLPEPLASYSATWLEVNPGWTLKLWTEDNLPPLKNSVAFEAADSFAQKSDIARFEIIERFGGVYVDMDFEALRPLDPIIEGLTFFAGIQGGTVVASGLFGAVPHHRVLTQAVNSLHARFIARRASDVAEQTGPQFITRVIHNTVDPQHDDTVQLFPPAYFYPYLPGAAYNGPRTIPSAYAVHHWNSFESGWETDVNHIQVSRWPSSLGDRAALVPAVLADKARQTISDAEQKVKRTLKTTLVRSAKRFDSVVGRPRAYASYVGNGRMMVRTNWGIPVVVPSADLSILPYLMWSGGYEDNLVRFIQRSIRAGDTAIDVGANVGLFTTLMGDAVGDGGRVYAYECNPHALEFLRANVASGGFSGRVEIVEMAAYSTSCTLTFSAPHDLLGLGSVRSDEALAGGQFDAIEVTAERIDEYISDKTRIKLIKIDVEGAELEVLEGLKGLINAGMVRFIVIELDYRFYLGKWDTVAEKLCSLEQTGARFAYIDHDGSLIYIPVDQVLTVGDYNNLVMDWGTE